MPVTLILPHARLSLAPSTLASPTPSPSLPLQKAIFPLSLHRLPGDLMVSSHKLYRRHRSQENLRVGPDLVPDPNSVPSALWYFCVIPRPSQNLCRTFACSNLGLQPYAHTFILILMPFEKMRELQSFQLLLLFPSGKTRKAKTMKCRRG